ncbi:MAG: dihydrofolate reductase [Ignavibacteriales bacterium]|nr:dihydrofolate reductase [Ignavibacteriales bacterium]
MKLIIIAALSRNRVIGKNGRIPWHISEDLKRFKRITTGHTVLMGRKTYESMGKPLANRRNVVLTSMTIPGVETFSSLGEALQGLAGQEKVFVIGGGELFAQVLESADEMHLTLVDKDVEGDAFFPPFEHLVGKVFKEVSGEQGDGFTFVDYKRIS